MSKEINITFRETANNSKINRFNYRLLNNYNRKPDIII